MGKRKLILFDYDGVLVDSMPFNIKVVSSVLENMGYQKFPTSEFCSEAECISFESWAHHIGMLESELPVYIKAIHEGVLAGAPSLPLFEGISAMVLKLASQHTLGLITASNSLAAKAFLTCHEIEHCFDHLVGGEASGTKCDKILEILKKYNYGKKDVYYIGDAGTDVQQGKLAGVNTVAVTWGFQSRTRLEKEEPDLIVDSPDELKDLLCSII
jgi:phosphoglycolate phosphatase